MACRSADEARMARARARASIIGEAPCFGDVFTFHGPCGISEIDILIVRADLWASRPQSLSPAWLATLYEDHVVAVRSLCNRPAAPVGIGSQHRSQRD